MQSSAWIPHEPEDQGAWFMGFLAQVSGHVGFVLGLRIGDPFASGYYERGV